MLRRTLARIAVGTVLFAAVPGVADAQVLRFSTTARGKVLGIGNTLGLSHQNNLNGPGLQDSIGTFLTLGGTVDNAPTNPGNPWPVGTTFDWKKNGSTAVLDMPSESQVLYAELVWGGSYNYGGEDVTASLNVPVTLSSGGGQSTTVAPDPATALTLAQTSTKGFAVNYYMRSADVTAFVQDSGSDVYAVSGVPSTQAMTINTLNAGGWTLTVVVRDLSQPSRNLSVFVGGSFVDENSQQDYTVSGFCTPPAGPVNGKVVISAIEGDASLVGDQFLIGPTSAGPFKNLSGPNNPANNFFCSQINGEDGTLDTQGSFGTANHDAINGVNVSGGRQGWDVTTVGVSSAAGQVQNAQTSAVLRTITTGDSYVPTLAAFAIDVNAPAFQGAGTSFALSTTSVSVGDSFTATLDLANTGLVTAEGVVLRMAVDPSLSLTGFTTDGVAGDANQTPVTAAALGAGVPEGLLAPGSARQVTMDFTVVAPPAGANIVFQPKWSYGFELCAGGTMLAESYAQFATLPFLASTSTASSSSAAVASSSSSSAQASSASSSSQATTGAGGAGGGGGGAGTGGAGGGSGGAFPVTSSGQGTGSAQGGGDGSGSDAGAGGGLESPGATGGCGCELGESHDASTAAALGLLATGLVVARRRKRSQRG